MSVAVPEEPEQEPKVKVARERVEAKNEHLAVRTSDGRVLQFPQADGFEIDDGDLIITSKTTELARVALIRHMFWDAIYYPGCHRIEDKFASTYYDAEGNELEDDEDDD